MTTSAVAVLEPVHDLGRLIESRFRRADYDEHRFPSLAGEALAESGIPGRIDPWEVLRAFHQAEPMPEQRDVEARFSDLPVTLYNGHGFYIDAYFWLDGTTEIHQHAFAGAFQVWAGSSLHSRYTFAREREINPHFLIGRLDLDDVEILEQGAIRPIVPGSTAIHSLFHLDRPSITLTVRTLHTPTAAPQYAYLKPSLAVNPFYRDAALSRKTQTLSLLLRMRRSDADPRIRELLAESDFATAFRLIETASQTLSEGGLRRALGLGSDLDRIEGLLEAARLRHGALVDLVPPVIAERRRQTEIAHRRATVTSEEHRFLLALLLNVSERTRLLRLVGARYPGRDPVETVVDWVEELGFTRVLGADENVLGLRGWDDDHVLVFEGLLRGMGEREIEAPLKSRVSEIAGKLRGATLFRATF